ncbi:MAG: autotransporter-associated beta strand repeat-containing protein [Kiritimatiellia bacterium]
MALLAGFAAGTLSAKICTWTAGAGVWSDAACWADGALPEDGDEVVFAGSAPGSVSLGGQTTAALRGVAFTDATGKWRLADGTLKVHPDGMVVSNSLSASVEISATLAGDGDLTKQGTGSLPLFDASAFTGRFIIEDGRLQFENAAALGAELQEFRADAIVLRGGVLGSNETDTDTPLVIGPTRGITLDGGGSIAVRSMGRLRIQSPIAGTGDLRILSQTGTLRLEAPCTYAGRTEVGAVGNYSSGTGCVLELGCDNALPATTCLSAAAPDSSVRTSTVAITGTVQRIAGIETTANVRLILRGLGTVRFGTDADAGGTIAVSNTYVSAGATLAYAGSGTVTPYLTTADGTTFALEGGALDMTAESTLGPASLVLGAGTTASFAAGAPDVKGDLVLAGNATLKAANPLALNGDLVCAADVEAARLTLAAGTQVTLGADDDRLRRLGVAVVPETDAACTLDGWILAETDPAGLAQTETCILFGPYAPEGTVEGTAVAVDAKRLGMTSVAALGEGVDALRVRNGAEIVFHTEEEAETFVAELDVDATSQVVFGGAGTFDLTGTTPAGAGTLRLAGARVVVQGDWSALTLAGGSGELYVPDGQTAKIAAATGAVRKTGPGTLVFAGTETNVCSLVVAGGEVRFAAAAVAVAGDVTVDAGARLVLDADEQIGDDASVYLEGTLDLNGHAESVQRVHNTPPSGTLRDTPTGRLVNTSSSPAVIATCQEDVFHGHVEEIPGTIEFRTRASNTSFFGPAGSAAPSKVVIDEAGCYFSYTRFRSLRFYFKKMRDSQRVPALADIQFTYQGRTLPRTLINAVSGNSLASGYQYAALCDGQAGTAWKAEKAEGVYVEIQFAGTYPRVDGYRLVPADLANAPTDWDVYAYRADPSGWFLVDRRQDEVVGPEDLAWSGFARNPGKTYAFSFEDRPREQLGQGSSVELVKGGLYRMRVSSLETLALGALSGAGDVRVEDGSWIAPGDMSGWTGGFIFQNTDGRANMARVLLDAGLGGAAQAVRVKGDNTNVSVENAGATPVSLLVDDATESTRLRLADGSGPMGLVKRGAGTVALAIDESANTGATVVEAGTLKVVGPLGAERLAKPVRYFRFTPTCVVGGAAYMDAYGYNWGAGDIQLLDAEGEVAPWPAGTTISAPWGGHGTATLACLIDGDPATRGLVKNRDSGTSTAELTPVTIDTKTGVAFAGYRWYTSSSGGTDKNRTPSTWILETSDDGTDWTVVSTGAQNWSGTDATGTANLRGPFTRDGVVRSASTLATLPKDFFAVETNRATRAPALKARYFRFAPHETYNPQGYENGYGWMVSEFALFRKTARVDWPAGTSATVTGGAVNGNNGSAVERICNNFTDGLIDTSPYERTFVMQMPSWVEIDAGEEVVFDGYGFYSAASGGYPQRIPVSWTFSVSSDGTTWHEVDNRVQERANVTLKEYTLQGIWSVADKFPLLDAVDATDALGDASPVAIASGAALEIDSVYEKFGTLSGAGTLKVNGGVVAEVNACVDGTFAGAVTGGGTLAVCGVATQTFDNAAIDVAAIELNGGTVAGTASRAGDLSLAFNGGAWSGSLAVSGALAVTGAPAVALPPPESVQDSFRQTLFSYASIDGASAAALAGAELRGALPQGKKARIRVGATSCVLTVGADGTILLVR